MIVNKNSFMKQLISRITELDSSEIVAGKFFRYGDCLIISDQEFDDFDVLAKNWNNDLTAIESHFNDFLINQEFDEKILDPRKRFEQAVVGGLVQRAIGVCGKLFAKVKNSEIITPEDSLKIIVTIDEYDQEIDENLELLDGAGGKVKLIKIRNDDYWLKEDLEIYQQPVMTIDFDKQSVQELPEKWWQV